LTCVVGIRSQSKPLDIMHEVFKAMKSLDYVSTCVFSSFTGVFFYFWVLTVLILISCSSGKNDGLQLAQLCCYSHRDLYKSLMGSGMASDQNFLCPRIKVSSYK